jgi:hypothetical protein
VPKNQGNEVASNERQEIFGIIVRTIGFDATVYSAYVLCFGILYWLGMPKRVAVEGALPSLIFGAFFWLAVCSFYAKPIGLSALHTGVAQMNKTDPLPRF